MTFNLDDAFRCNVLGASLQGSLPVSLVKKINLVFIISEESSELPLVEFPDFMPNTNFKVFFQIDCSQVSIMDNDIKL